MKRSTKGPRYINIRPPYLSDYQLRGVGDYTISAGGRYGLSVEYQVYGISSYEAMADAIAHVVQLWYDVAEARR